MKKIKQPLDAVEFVIGGPLPVVMTRAAIDRTSLEFDNAESYARHAETALAKAVQKHYKIGSAVEVWRREYSFSGHSKWVRYKIVGVWMTKVFLRRWRFGKRIEIEGNSILLRRPEEVEQPTDPDMRRFYGMPMSEIDHTKAVSAP
jgi:hypothetical protein